MSVRGDEIMRHFWPLGTTISAGVGGTKECVAFAEQQLAALLIDDVAELCRHFNCSINELAHRIVQGQVKAKE